MSNFFSLDELSQEEVELEKQFEEELIKMGVKMIPAEEVQRDSQIGEGGFGKVYKGTYNNQTVAIKKIKLQNKELGVYQEILNEIQVILKVNSPKIPKFLGIMKRKGKYNLIIEFIPGETLKKIANTLTKEEKLHIIYELCEILEDFHSRNLIHRDIKPGNIMVIPSKNIKLIDFGVSKIAIHTITYTKDQKGTIPYISPEQFQIDLEKFSDPNINDIRPVKLSTKSDIWSLGVTISEIFSGIPPYYNINKNKEPNQLMLTRRLSNNRPFPIPDNLDENIKSIVEKATIVNPELRGNASEIKKMVEKVINEM